MVEYPTDAELNEQKDIFVDEAGDISLVSGIDQLAQSVGIDIFDETQDFTGSKLTGLTIGRLEAQIRDGLDNDPQLDDIVSVTIRSFDEEAGNVFIEVVTTANNEFTLPIEL